MTTSRRALVTGGTGFVGARVVRHLLDLGWAVHVVVRRSSNLSLLEECLSRVTLHTFDGDIDALRKIVRASNPEVVYHLASLFLSVHRPWDVQRLVESNISFGAMLVDAMCLEGAARLINTGTSWEHFGNSNYSPVNLYAATKHAFESLLSYYSEAHGLQVITLKLCDTYGPLDPRNKLIRQLLSAAKSGELLLMSPGEQYVDLVHVEDVASAYLIAADILAIDNQPKLVSFGITSGAALTLKDLVDEVERILRVSINVKWGGRPYRAREALTPWKPRDVLPGWQPAIRLSAGIAALNVMPMVADS